MKIDKCEPFFLFNSFPFVSPTTLKQGNLEHVVVHQYDLLYHSIVSYHVRHLLRIFSTSSTHRKCFICNPTILCIALYIIIMVSMSIHHVSLVCVSNIPWSKSKPSQPFRMFLRVIRYLINMKRVAELIIIQKCKD